MDADPLAPEPATPLVLSSTAKPEKGGVVMVVVVDGVVDNVVVVAQLKVGVAA